MAALSATPLRIAPAMLRPLRGFERLFLAIDKINGFNFGIAVSFSSVIADVSWKAAFEQVRRRHPLLNAGINDEDPHAPYFTGGADLPIPLAFQRRISSTDWQRVMESDIAEPFNRSTGPLLRAAVLGDDSAAIWSSLPITWPSTAWARSRLSGTCFECSRANSESNLCLAQSER